MSFNYRQTYLVPHDALRTIKLSVIRAELTAVYVNELHTEGLQLRSGIVFTQRGVEWTCEAVVARTHGQSRARIRSAHEGQLLSKGIRA